MGGVGRERRVNIVGGGGRVVHWCDGKRVTSKVGACHGCAGGREWGVELRSLQTDGHACGDESEKDDEKEITRRVVRQRDRDNITASPSQDSKR